LVKSKPLRLDCTLGRRKGDTSPADNWESFADFTDQAAGLPTTVGPEPI
jgi:hypothetical protein